MRQSLCRLWTPDEDKKLLVLLNEGRSWLLIAARMKRTIGAVRTRVSVLERQAKAVEGPKMPNSECLRHKAEQHKLLASRCRGC